MAVPPSKLNKGNDKPQNQQWIVESIELAQKQIKHASEISEALFAGGDLTEYLNLMCRMPYYHFLNLLLIYEQYPSAVCLAGTRVWGKILGTQYPLKQEHAGKSITLLAPFTNGAAGELVWYSVNVYDVSQTHVKNLELPTGAYIRDHEHINFLLDAVIEVLARKYSQHVVIESNPALLQRLNIPGRVSGNAISVIDKLTDAQKLYWLTENICQQHIKSKAISSHSAGLLVQTLCSCLFKVWGITKSMPTIPKGSYSTIIKEEQHPFLNILQHSFYSIDQQISSAYIDARNEASDVTIIPEFL